MSKLNYSDNTRKASTTEGKKSEENVTLETNKASKTPESTQDSSAEQKEKKFDWSSFLSNILAVVLGIFITFWIQGLIDRRSEKKDLSSALELVKEELVNNKSNLQDVLNIMEAEKEAAGFIGDNVGNLAKCDTSKLNSSHLTLGSEYFCTITDDALELLKASSLFQKMNDKNLALSIIKSYDYLEASAQAFNTHEKYKTSLFNDAVTDKAKKTSLTISGTDYLKRFYSTPEADYFLRSVIEISNNSSMTAIIPEIDATIAEIDSRLK